MNKYSRNPNTLNRRLYKNPLTKVNPGNPEFEMFAFFEMTPDLVCIAGKDGFFKKINPAVSKKLGYPEEELFANPVSSFIHPEDKQVTGSERRKLLEGKALINFQNRYITKTGEIVWLEWTSIYLPDKEVVFAIAKDVTQRKQAEKETEEKYQKFKNLAVHFKSIMEEDRKYLAVELHEELAQLASIVKLDFDWLNVNESTLQTSSKKRVEHGLIIAELLINTIRRISFSVSPHMIEDLGLNAALKLHCKEFSILSGVTCTFESAYDESALTREVKLDFFRICQESLMNVMCHAQANNVKVRIENAGSKICLTITDYGNGFEVNSQKPIPGLIRMQERVASINGELTIQSITGKGTTISVTVTKQ